MLFFLLALTAILASQTQSIPICRYTASKDFYESLYFRKYDYSCYLEVLLGYDWYAIYSTESSEYTNEIVTYKDGVVYDKLIDSCGVEHDFQYPVTPYNYNSAYYLDGSNKIVYSIYFATEYIALLNVTNTANCSTVTTMYVRKDRYGYSCTDALVSAFYDLLNFLGCEFPYEYADYTSAVQTVSLTAEADYASTIYVNTCKGAVIGAEE